jgi:hypothetical protein
MTANAVGDCKEAAHGIDIKPILVHRSSPSLRSGSACTNDQSAFSEHTRIAACIDRHRFSPATSIRMKVQAACQFADSTQ